MSNLLPAQAQKRVRRMYRARLIIALALTLFALAGALFLALIPSYLSLASAPRVSGAEAVRRAEDSQAIARAQVIVSAILPVLAATNTPSIYLEAALAAQPSSVKVDRITFTTSERGGSLLLIGEASREKVAAFRDALSAHPLFRSATVPVSSLVGTGAGQFSLTLEFADGKSE